MNKQLENKIKKVELEKQKEIEKRNVINDKISFLDDQLKTLYDYKKQQEKIYQLQHDLDEKITSSSKS